MTTSRTARILSAACLMATGLALVASTALIPSSGDSSGDRIDAFAAHSARVDGALTADVFVLLLGAATALAALLAWPRSRKLAPIAGWLGIISGSAMVFLVGLDFATNAAVGTARSSSEKLLDNIDSAPQFPVFLALALLGGLVAMVCLGLALWRTQAVPRWAAAALIAYEPANVLTADAGAVLFAAANALLLVGFTACAVTILRNGFPGSAADLATTPAAAHVG